MDKKLQILKEELPKSIVKLTITTDPADLPHAMEEAYEHLYKDVEIKGFRKGTAPKQMIMQELGIKLYDEAINHLIWDSANQALMQEELSPITQPEFVIQEAEEDKPLTFAMQFAVYPKIVIGDLNKISLKREDITKAKKMRDDIQRQEEEKKQGKKETIKELTSKEKEQKATHTKKEEVEEKEEEKDPFSLELYYSDILDKVFALSTMEIPEAIITSEIANQTASFTKRLEDLNIAVEDYLKLQGTTLEKVQEEWKKDIEFSLKQDFLLTEYAKNNNITAENADIEKNLAEVYTKEQIEKLDPNMYNYVRFALVKQKAFLNLINTIEKNNEKDSKSK